MTEWMAGAGRGVGMVWRRGEGDWELRPLNNPEVRGGTGVSPVFFERQDVNEPSAGRRCHVIQRSQLGI